MPRAVIKQGWRIVEEGVIPIVFPYNASNSLGFFFHSYWIHIYIESLTIMIYHNTAFLFSYSMQLLPLYIFSYPEFRSLGWVRNQSQI